MGEKKFVGSKYEAVKDLRVVEVAKLVRVDLAKAFPGFKFSVRSDHNSINVRVSHGKERLPSMRNPARIVADHERVQYPYSHPAFLIPGKPGEELLAKMDAVLQAYNYDNSDSMTDYFDVNFYGHVQIAHEVEADEQAWVVAAYEEGKARLGAVQGNPRDQPWAWAEQAVERVVFGAQCQNAAAKGEPPPALPERYRARAAEVLGLNDQAPMREAEAAAWQEFAAVPEDEVVPGFILD